MNHTCAHNNGDWRTLPWIIASQTQLLLFTGRFIFNRISKREKSVDDIKTSFKSRLKCLLSVTRTISHIYSRAHGGTRRRRRTHTHPRFPSKLASRFRDWMRHKHIKRNDNFQRLTIIFFSLIFFLVIILLFLLIPNLVIIFGLDTLFSWRVISGNRGIVPFVSRFLGNRIVSSSEVI